LDSSLKLSNMKISNNTTFDLSVVLLLNNMSLLMKDMSTIAGHLSKIMTSSSSFNHLTTRSQHRKRVKRSVAWLNLKRSDNSDLTTFSSRSSQEFITNTMDNSKVHSSSIKEAKNSVNAAVVSNSNHFNSIKRPNIDSSKKTKVCTIKKSFKLNDDFNEDMKLKFTTDNNKIKTVGRSRRMNHFDEEIDTKSTEKTFNSKKSSNAICSSSLPTKIKEILENTIGDATEIKNEIQRFIAKRTIRQFTTLKETITKTLNSITMDIDSAINIDNLFFPNQDYNELRIYIEEIKKHEESFYFEFLNEEEIQIFINFYD
ncbi:hypothetical protein O181_033965, partial [Austropuccinia psidii MF-1]|nr:hypothetical protein [Austropuccinia psidii MF-1]